MKPSLMQARSSSDQRSDSTENRSRNMGNLPCRKAIVFHIGAGTIKVYAGTKRRAPTWISNSGIEWIHRIVFEPHTRARYALGTLHFIRRLIRQ